MPDTSRPDWSGRLEQLCARLSDLGLPALAITAPVNLRYLTGYNGSAGLLLITASDAWLLADGRYELSIQQAVAAGTVGPVRFHRVTGRYETALLAIVARIGCGVVGFEAEHVTVGLLARWERAARQVRWQPTDRILEAMRAVKDAREIATLRQAGRRLAGVARALPQWVRRDRTEQEVAIDIDQAMKHAGFSAPAFPTIVASGPNSAHPHARPGERRLTDGDLVVLDFGGVLDGYCVDLTRMAAIGQVTTEQHTLYQAVRESQGAALAVVRPGIPASDVDRAARDVLEVRGLGAAFLHATGHGLGLEVHEAPRIGRADLDAPVLLETGMVFTVEPGAYLDGLGGARLEDDVLVTTEGSEVLTDSPRDLLIV